MPTPHRHANIIKAWADGKTIQTKYTSTSAWEDLLTHYPTWENTEYRIKPEPTILHGFIDPLMLEYKKNPYAVFRPNKLTSNSIPCTLTILPDA